MSGDLYITGAQALTVNDQNETIPNAALVVENGRITALGKAEAIPPPENATILDATDCLLLPGLINCHTHLGMGLYRGVAEDLPLEKWLEEFIFPLERKWGSHESVYLGSLVSLIEMIRMGTTTINDMYYYERSTARAVADAGVRGICGYTVVEISGVQKTDHLFDKLDRFTSQIKDFKNVMPSVAPHSVYGVKRETLEKLIGYCEEKGLPLHLHLSESPHEVEECLKAHDCTPVAYCERLGLFRVPVFAAHAVCLTDTDIAALKKHQVGIAHNPESNLKVGSKICPVKKLREAGVSVGLGTDGVASNNNLDLLQEIDMATKLQTLREGIGALKTVDALRMLTIEAAQALGLDKEIGSLEVGKRADIIAVGIDNEHSIPLYDPYAHLVYSATGHDVKHTIIDGRVVMQDQKITSLDVPAIHQEAREWGKKIGAWLKR